MLRLLATEEIQALLGRVSELVRLFEEKDSSFVEEVKGWLMQAEQLLKNSQLDGVSEISGLRLALISAEQGAVPEFVNLQGHPSRRKIKHLTAADVLQRGARRVSASISSFATQIAEAERLIRQMLPVAQKKGLIYQADAATPRSEALTATWNAMESDPDLASVAIHVCGLVGKHDALILLDRCLLWLTLSEAGTPRAALLQLAPVDAGSSI